MKSLIEVKEFDVIYNDPRTIDLKRFILPGEITSQGQYLKGFLGITSNCVYIQSEWNKAYGIMFPRVLNGIYDTITKNNTLRALSWILLGFTGFKVDNGSSFFNQDPNFKFNISYDYFINGIFMQSNCFRFLLQQENLI